jgi:hypothetical protein
VEKKKWFANDMGVVKSICLSAIAIRTKGDHLKPANFLCNRKLVKVRRGFDRRFISPPTEYSMAGAFSPN